MFPKGSSWSTSDGHPSVKYYVMVKDYMKVKGRVHRMNFIIKFLYRGSN